MGECWSEWKFFTELAGELGMGDKFPWKTERSLIEHEVGPTGLTFDECLEEKPEGAYYQQKRYGMEEARFSTPTGKIEIYSDALAHIGFDPLPTYLDRSEARPRPRSARPIPAHPFDGKPEHVLYAWTISGHRGAPGEEPRTARGVGAGDGGPVRHRKWGQGHHRNEPGPGLDEGPRRRAGLEGVVLVPHGWPGDANANLLTDTRCREPIMGYTEVKSLLCAIRKA